MHILSFKNWVVYEKWFFQFQEYMVQGPFLVQKYFNKEHSCKLIDLLLGPGTKNTCAKLEF